MSQKKIFPVLPIDIVGYLKNNKSRFDFKRNSYELYKIRKYCKNLYIKKFIKNGKNNKKLFYRANFRLLYELAQLIFHLKIIKQLNKIKYKFVLNRKVVNYEKVIDFYFREYQSKTIKRFTSEKSEKDYFIKFWINLKNYFLDLILKGKNIYLLKNNTIEIKNFIKKRIMFSFSSKVNSLRRGNNKLYNYRSFNSTL